LFGEGALVSNLEFVFRLPDFIFERERAAEEAYGFTLAGKLATDIPRHSEPGEGDRQLISEIVGELTRLAQRDPGLQEASGGAAASRRMRSSRRFPTPQCAQGWSAASSSACGSIATRLTASSGWTTL
jgi:hypothetical protein